MIITSSPVGSQDVRGGLPKVEPASEEDASPIIAVKVWATFLRGDYYTAVFQAFKEVEVAVRSAAGYGATDYGVALMNKAFEKNGGPLTDTCLPESEREALRVLLLARPARTRTRTATDM